MILAPSKIKYIKNVSSTSGSGLVYMGHGIKALFDLEFSKWQYQQVDIGDQIVLEQQGKLTHVVEVQNPKLNYNQNNLQHPYTMKVKTIAIIPNGFKKTDSSIFNANFTCLRGNTNLIPIGKVGKNVENIGKRIVDIFKNNFLAI